MALESKAGSLMDTWPEWKDKILKLSRLESGTRPLLRQLLSELESKDGLALPEGMFFFDV